MTATLDPAGLPRLTGGTSRSRRLRNAFATAWMYAAVVVALVPLAAVVYYVVSRGIGMISAEWFTEEIPAVSRRPGGGMSAAIVGTIVITAGAALMAIPLGILGAVYLHEYGGSGRLARFIRFMADVMTGVPSIVMGLFVYAVYTLRFGLNGFGGSLALACLMLPVVIRSTEEMLRLVPDELRHGSLALGNRQWRTVMTVVLPAALPGIVSGAMLAIARAAGETAPLLFTIGAVRAANPNLLDGPNTALSVQIFGNANSTLAAPQDRAWGAALTLVGIVFLCTLLARFVSNRFAIKER